MGKNLNEKQEKDWKDYLAKGAVIVNPPKEKEEESCGDKCGMCIKDFICVFLTLFHIIKIIN